MFISNRENPGPQTQITCCGKNLVSQIRFFFVCFSQKNTKQQEKRYVDFILGIMLTLQK
jgi:hypothetical protein